MGFKMKKRQFRYISLYVYETLKKNSNYHEMCKINKQGHLHYLSIKYKIYFFYNSLKIKLGYLNIKKKTPLIEWSRVNITH